MAAAMRTLQPLLQGADMPHSANRTLTADECKKLWVPLLRLRQACCHPQVICSWATIHI